MTRSVLIVDDDPGIREVIGDLLTEAGFAVAFARDGLEALDQLAHARADVILTDVTMPRLSGVALVARLRERGDRTPVVLMSAAQPPGGISGVAFVAKPFDSDQLLTTITDALASERSGDPPPRRRTAGRPPAWPSTSPAARGAPRRRTKSTPTHE